jgi:hypothetical protein
MIHQLRPAITIQRTTKGILALDKEAPREVIQLIRQNGWELHTLQTKTKTKQKSNPPRRTFATRLLMSLPPSAKEAALMATHLWLSKTRTTLLSHHAFDVITSIHRPPPRRHSRVDVERLGRCLPDTAISRRGRLMATPTVRGRDGAFPVASQVLYIASHLGYVGLVVYAADAG